MTHPFLDAAKKSASAGEKRASEWVSSRTFLLAKCYEVR